MVTPTCKERLSLSGTTTGAVALCNAERRAFASDRDAPELRSRGGGAGAGRELLCVNASIKEEGGAAGRSMEALSKCVEEERAAQCVGVDVFASIRAQGDANAERPRRGG